MFSGHSIVTINNYDLIQVSDIKNYSANFNPHLYFTLGVPRWYFKKVRSYFLKYVSVLRMFKLLKMVCVDFTQVMIVFQIHEKQHW